MRSPQDLIELRIYKGADGTFDLYQDAGDSYDYEKGAHAVIPLRWSESNQNSDDRRSEGASTPKCLRVFKSISSGCPPGTVPQARASRPTPTKLWSTREGNFGLVEP